MRQALTVGFEEAFLLVDDVDGAPLPRADEVLSRRLANLGADDSARFEPRHGTGATRRRIAARLGIGDLVDAFRLTSEGMALSADGHDCSAAFAQPRGSTP
ncbi:hypothetical protein [Nocardia sp. NPDC059239]|uniref:hypothetical protein n=1 Tax=unclassified Nocardia TaxID=2637762 RepID=UPI003694E38A